MSLFLACSCILLATGCASADRRGSIPSVSPAGIAAFTKQDEKNIGAYYREKRPRSAYPQHRLHAGDILPAHSARNILPSELEEKLSPLPAGYVRVKTGHTLLILDKQSSLIADAFDL